MRVVYAADDPKTRAQINKGGRPVALEANQETLRIIEQAASILASQREVAGLLGVSLRTFEQFLAERVAAREAWEKGIAVGKMSLRRTQFELAKDNAAMAIHLGMNYLGQQDMRNQAATTVNVAANDASPTVEVRKEFTLSIFDGSRRDKYLQEHPEVREREREEMLRLAAPPKAVNEMP